MVTVVRAALALATAAAVLAVVLSDATAQTVQTVVPVLVSNADQSAETALATASGRVSYAQSFRTGDHADGYFLSSVELGLAVESGVSVEAKLLSSAPGAAPPGKGTAALPAITIAAGASPVTEGTPAVFTLSRTGSTTDALTVNVTVSEAGGDMVAASNEGARTVTFLANSTTVTLSIATASDSVAEANSVVTATISADTGSPASYSVGAPGSAMVTVRDDDSNITVPGAPTDLSASSGGNTRINLSWTAPGDDGGSPITGYKIEVSPDGNANWTELVATGNTTTTYAHIGLAVGTTRHYRVSAINSVGAGDPSNIDDATVIITTVTLRTQSIPEGIGTAAVLVTLNQPAGDPLSVPWYTLNGDAVSPGDYTAGAGQLIIPSGATSATISITIIDDADAEATETVLVLLSPGEGYVLGGSGATLSILDDDGDGPAPDPGDGERHNGGADVQQAPRRRLNAVLDRLPPAHGGQPCLRRRGKRQRFRGDADARLTRPGGTDGVARLQPTRVRPDSGRIGQQGPVVHSVVPGDGQHHYQTGHHRPPASRPISRHQPAGIPGSTSHGPPPAPTAVPPSSATRSRSRPTATPTGPSSSPIQATPPPPTRTAAWPSARPATTGCPPSTLPAPADPPTSTTPLSSSRP